MSQENVEIVRLAREAYERGDWTEMVRHIDSEAIITREVPDGATFHGPDGLARMIADWVEGFDEFTFTTQELIDANDHHVVVRTHQTAVGSQSGVRIEADFWFVYELSDARVTRLDIVPSKARALEAAGLRE
jgi:ketosteroid isomerase-like protein